MPVLRQYVLIQASRWSILLPLTCALMLTMLVAASARAESDGAIEGQVVNKTPHGPTPAGLEVTLYTVQGGTPIGQQAQVTDSQGSFRFSGLSTDATLNYLLVTEYEGVRYFQIVTFPQDESSGKVGRAELVVYETTSARDGLLIERTNWLVAAVEPGVLTFLEMGALANSSERTIVSPGVDPTGSEIGTVQFLLPRQAMQITPEFGLTAWDLQPMIGGFKVLSPVKPGRYEYAFSFRVPFDSPTLELTRALAHPVGSFTLYFPETAGVQVEAPSLSPGPSADIAGQRWQTFTSQGLKPGDHITLRLSGLPLPESTLVSRIRMVAVALLAVALVSAVLVVYARRRTAKEPGPAPALDGPLSGDNQGLTKAWLLTQLAQLDEAWSAGQISRDEYASRRAEVKEQLLHLMKSDR